MRENWKDYLAPGALAAGLLTLLIGVAVFGTPVYAQEVGRLHIVEDEKEPEPQTSSSIKVPETRDSYELDEWTDALAALVNKGVDSYNPENVKKIIEEQTDLTESDGAFYYYAVGFLHDRFVRQSKTFRKSNYTRAVENYTKAIERDDSVALFYHFRGQVNYFYAAFENTPEFYDRAVEDYKLAEKADPKWPMPVDMQGYVEIRKGNGDEAVKHLERALEIDPECLDALNCIIDVYLKKTNDDPNEIEACKKGLEYIRRLHTALNNGKKFGTIGSRKSDAQHFTSRLVASENIIFETHPEYFSRQDKLNVIHAVVNNGEYEKALQMLIDSDKKEESIYFYSSAPQINDAVDYQVQWCYVACFYGLGRFEEAFEAMPSQEELKKYYNIRRTFQNHSLHYYYVATLAKLEHYQDIVDWSKEERKPAYYEMENYINLHVTDALFELGQNEDAMENFASKLLHFDGRRWEMFLSSFEGNDGIYERIREKYIEACYKKALKENADDAKQANSGTHRLMSYFNRRQQVSVDPSPELFKKMATVLASNGDHTQAARHFEQYCYFEPNDEEALCDWLACMEKTNAQDQNAISVATRLITLAPDNPDYRMKRARLQSRVQPASQSNIFHDLTRVIELPESGETANDLLLQSAYANRAEIRQASDKLAALEDWMKALVLARPGAKCESVVVETFRHPDGQNIFDVVIEILRSTEKSEKRKAIPYCTQLIEAGADELLLLCIRADLYRSTQQYQEAIDDYTVVFDSEPSKRAYLSKSGCLHQLALCYQGLKKIDVALEYFTLALEEDPANWAVYANRTRIYDVKANQFGPLTDEQRNHFRELAEQDRKKAKELQNSPTIR